MISSTISEKVLTMGPDPSGKGGMASVVQYYRDELFSKWNFIKEARTDGGKLSKLSDAVIACFRLMRLLWANKDIQIVHLHTAGKVSFPRSCVFMRIAKMMGRKVVLHIHSGAFSTYCAGREKKIGKYLKQADTVIVVGKTWVNYYQETFGLSNLYVVPNIVPDKIAQSDDLNPRYAQKRIHALFLGQLVDTKGIFDLLEALSKVKEKLRDKFVLHVGGKGDTDRFLSEIDRLQLDGIVVYEGWVSAEKKTELLMKSSISILPSYFEGLPISLLEGMVYGHALVATNVGSISEILDSSNGYIFLPGQVELLSELIAKLVYDRMDLIAKGENSKAKVKPYLPENVAKNLSALYEELLKK